MDIVEAILYSFDILDFSQNSNKFFCFKTEIFPVICKYYGFLFYSDKECYDAILSLLNISTYFERHPQRDLLLFRKSNQKMIVQYKPLDSSSLLSSSLISFFDPPTSLPLTPPSPKEEFEECNNHHHHHYSPRVIPPSPEESRPSDPIVKDKVWCHQCKKKSSEYIQCLNSACKKKYCKNCLYRHYNEDYKLLSIALKSEKMWFCYSCKNECRCAVCRRKRGENVPKKHLKKRKMTELDDKGDTEAFEKIGEGDIIKLIRKKCC